MFGNHSIRRLLDMAHEAVGSQPPTPTTPFTPSTPHTPARQPTKYYFAYGSNLHLCQMKRRCPDSKYIGCARLSNYRWQINERGYANVVRAEGHWVEGLVYEIDEKDEAQLDINEGVSKNCYAKHYMTVRLHVVQRALYRRPVSWIVDKGGPTNAMRQNSTRELSRTASSDHPRPELEVLVYVSFDYIQDAQPKEEYITRINLGFEDARALGVDEDYIRNIVRPYVPAQAKAPTTTSTNRKDKDKDKDKGKQPARGVKRTAQQRAADKSPARKHVPSRSEGQISHHASAGNKLQKPQVEERRAASDCGASSPAPPLPPRPLHRSRSAILVEETYNHYRSR